MKINNPHHLQVLKCQQFATSERFDEKVINMISRDMNKIDYALATSHEIYRTPLEVIFIGFFVYKEIGEIGLLGMLLLLAAVPFLCEFSSNSKFHNENFFIFRSFCYTKVIKISLQSFPSHREASRSDG